MKYDFFPSRPNITPRIYAYEDTNPQYLGLLKIGYTSINTEDRVAQQYPIKKPGQKPYRIVLDESAIRNDGSSFHDHEVHRFMRRQGFKNPEGEWFKCCVDDVKAAILAIKNGEENVESRTQDFKMRPEQQEAVNKTIAHFKNYNQENPNKTPHFLWNAKMRFGKTFASYQLAKKMKWKKVLVLTFKPAVQSAWQEDLQNHIDFEGWQFISRNGLNSSLHNKLRPMVKTKTYVIRYLIV